MAVYPELVRRGIIPDMVTDQTSAHDALNGYIPADLSLEEADKLRRLDPQAYIKRSMESMVTHVRAMLDMHYFAAVKVHSVGLLCQEIPKISIARTRRYLSFFPKMLD